MIYTIKDVSKEYRTWGPDGDDDIVTDEMYEIVDEDGLLIYRTNEKLTALRYVDLLNRDRIMSAR